MHAIPAFIFFAGNEACTRRSSSSSSSSSSRPRIAARADRSTASAVLAAGGGAARLLAEPRSCLASSSPGRKQKPSIQSYCVGPGVGRLRHVKVRMCAFLFLFFARTLQNTAKKYKIQKKTEHNGKTISENYEGPRTNQ